MVSVRVSVVHVPSGASMGVEIGDVRDQSERAWLRHEVHDILARRRGVGHRGGGRYPQAMDCVVGPMLISELTTLFRSRMLSELGEQ